LLAKIEPSLISATTMVVFATMVGFDGGGVHNACVVDEDAYMCISICVLGRWWRFQERRTEDMESIATFECQG
jgi:hypothetical protein